MKKIFALLLALIMCVALFSACSEKDDETTPANLSEVNKELNDITVATIDGINVSQAYYNLIYSQQLFNIKQGFQDLTWLDTEIQEGETGRDYLKSVTKKQVEQRVMARILAEKNGITLTPEMQALAKDEVAQFLQTNGQEFLIDSHTTEKTLLSYFEEQYVIEALMTKLSEEGGPAQLTDENLAAAEEMFNKYFLKVQHILIQTADAQTGATIRSDEDALKKANEVIAKLKNGADFDSLIPQYNEDPGMSQGNYYTFGQGEMVQEFEIASSELKVGEYTTEPVKTQYGYHVIKKYSRETDIPEFEYFKNMEISNNVAKIVDDEIAKTQINWNYGHIDSFINTFIAEQRAKLVASGN